MTHDDFPRRHPDASFQTVGDEGGLVVLPGRAEVKVLNPVGIRIFSMLDGKTSEDAIAAAIVEEFDITPEAARDDLRQFLADLDSNGMLAGARDRAAAEDG